MTLAIKTTDAFTRTAALSGSTLDNANGGSEANTWTVVNGTWDTVGGRATNSSASGNYFAVVSSTAPVSRQKVTINSYEPSSGVVARWAAAGTYGTMYLYLRDYTTNKSRLYKCDGTNFTQLGSEGATVINDGDLMTLDCDGTTITALLNGVSQVSVTDATYNSGVPGMYSGGNSYGELDNFKYEVEGSASGFFLMF